MPLVLIGLTELCLTLLGIGTNTTLVMRSARPKVDPPYYLNMQADFAYSSIDLRGPEPRAFTLPKPDSVFRIVVIGESSVQGFPYPTEMAFPRQLQLILDRQLPTRQVEVLNAGIVGLSSTPLVDILRQSLAAAPDVVVIYVGHNEFYGVGGVATTARVRRLGIALRRYRLTQWLTSFWEPAGQQSQTLITRLSGNRSIAIDDDLIGRAEENYRRNLTDMIRACEKAGVKVLVCGVASNLRDQSPVQGPIDRSGDGDTLQGRIAAAETLIGSGEHAAALDVLESAEALFPNDSLITYRLAQCLEALDHHDEAYETFSKARDLDGCRFRALGRFRDIAQATVNAAESPHVHFVDIADACREAVSPRTPGHDLFLEHVHFNLEGHWVVARSLGQRLVEDVCRLEWRAEAVPTAEERDEWLGIIPLDRLSAAILSSFVIQSPPLSEARDARRQLESATADIRTAAATVAPDDLRLFERLDNNTKVDDLVHGIGQLRLERDETVEALAMFELAQRRRPWMPHSFIFAAICHHLLHDDAAAREDLRRAGETIVAETGRLTALRYRLEQSLR